MILEKNKAEVLELWQRFLGSQPTHRNFRYVIKQVAPLREEAGKKLLDDNPSHDDIQFVIEWVKSLRELGGRRLLKDNPTLEDLQCVIRWVEPLREAAKQLMPLSKRRLLRKLRRLCG